MHMCIHPYLSAYNIDTYIYRERDTHREGERERETARERQRERVRERERERHRDFIGRVPMNISA